jgi:hypothetical protein
MFRSFDSLIGRSCIAADVITRRYTKSPIRAFKAIVGPSWGPIPSYAYSLISFAGLQVNKGLISFETFSNFLVDPKNPIRFIGGRIIANVRIGYLESMVANIRKGVVLPRLDFKQLGRLFVLNQGAARGYIEDEIVSMYNKIEYIQKNYIKELQNLLRNPQGHLIPEYVLESLFYPGERFLKPVKLIDLDTLSFEELVERLDKLNSIYRDFIFYKIPVSQKLVMDDSFKLLRLIMKARKRGSISIETTRLI